MRDFPLILSLSVCSALALILCCVLGSTTMPLDRVMAGLLGYGTSSDQMIVWDIRLPRGIAAFLVGSALAMSGAALQGLLRNPLAEPGVLGVTSMASLGATIAIYYGFAALSHWALPIFSVGGALAATFFIMLASARTQSITTLILIGVGISSFSGALMSFVMNMAPNPFTLSEMINWMLGSVSNRSFADLKLMAPFIVSGMVILFFASRSLSVLTLGEEAATGLGVNTKRLRMLIIIGSGLATGGAVALAGAIGFVGIIIPHMIRPFVDHDPARSLVPSAIAGGLALTLADILVRILPTLNELKLGVAAALFGAPFFIWIVLRQRINHV